jgi:hypothetical protein
MYVQGSIWLGEFEHGQPVGCVAGALLNQAAVRRAMVAPARGATHEVKNDESARVSLSLLVIHALQTLAIAVTLVDSGSECMTQQA